MSTVTCPNGHASGDPEWCDTCGAKIGSTTGTDPAVHLPAAVAEPGSNEPNAASTPTSATIECPHCAAANPADNLFCEECGYDFTTGQTPPDQAPALARPEPAADVPLGAAKWIVVVEISPVWYDLKGALADQPCPPPSSSTVALAQHAALVGRSSQSLGVRPEIGLDNDTGVSRRHAQFLRDGDTVSVIDLSSTNGTYVIRSADGDPDDDTPAIEPGVATELADGDRIYVGAWSQLTVRIG